MNARARTAAGLRERSAALGRLTHGADISIVLMGSWGRAEVTSGSDDDFVVLVGPDAAAAALPTEEQVGETLHRKPGEEGVFGATVKCGRMIDDIGLEEDVNSNLTHRMLLLLESVPATAPEVHAAVRRMLLERYVDGSVKDYRPPRLLLNDLIRYWRTICVDFAGKEQKRRDKWGLRNAKLRTSRKMLFAGGLLPVFACAAMTRSQMTSFLLEQLQMPPTDRVAQAFLRNDAADAGGRALGAYDEFLGLLDDAEFREQLQQVTRETADESDAFGEVKRIARDFEMGLLSLLFETPRLAPLVRQYAIF